ncbi:hypothetical protein RFI_30324 [Reticulomyxa filosa]|uniref:Uncharacterized protein n=1 Tax=Reticulomyxa filosa TaxID=46433 RepID=X6LZM6_RETFI|nr:hypothetical protein RFI_30324 [Reticulomyxa filosa]|eukprot:ETO07069.1 hypothetical protein RFI_30324 [Reticulomyxa filosa]
MKNELKRYHNNNNSNNNKHQSRPSNASAYPNKCKSMISQSSNGRKGYLISLFEDYNSNNGDVRVASKHVTNYNMMRAVTEQRHLKHVFNTLRSAAKKLLNDDNMYHTLYMVNHKVEERLFEYEGVINFLLLLGFDSDVMGQRFICKEKLNQEVIRTAIRVLDGHESKLKAVVNMDSAMLAYGIPVVSSEPNNSINANNADGSESDDINIQQIVLLCTHEQQKIMKS